MLEILLLIYLSMIINRMAKEKGRNGAPYVAMLIGFWLTGEMLGFLTRGFFAFAQRYVYLNLYTEAVVHAPGLSGVQGFLADYALALLGAGCGAGLAFLIAAYVPSLHHDPAERFWRHYSPRHEFPLSSALCFTAFFLFFSTLVGLMLIGAKWLSARESMPVEPIVLGGGGEGGEGGNNGRGSDPNPPEDIDTADKLPDNVKPRVKLSDIPHPKVETSSFSDVVSPDDATSKPYFDNGNLAVVSFGSVQDEARKKLMEGLRGKPGKPGEPGGDGPGPGGKGKILNERQKRVLRWTMMFDTRDGRDYLQQLAALKAFVAVPGAKGYEVIRDLHAGATGKVEDLKELKRIFWVDNRPESVKPLATALGLKTVPDHLVAFFPQELEDELLKKELKFNGLKEDEIQETRFRVLKRGTAYVPIVVEQTKKP